MEKIKTPFEKDLNGEFVPGENYNNNKNESTSRKTMPNEKIVNKNVYLSLKLFFFAAVGCLIVGGFMFLGLIEDGYFKSDINQEVNLKPNITSSTFNNYSFIPNTSNDYNYTIINEINCPAITCNCGDIQ